MEPFYMILHFAVKFRRAIPLNITVLGYVISFFLGLSKISKGLYENRALKI